MWRGFSHRQPLVCVWDHCRCTTSTSLTRGKIYFIIFFYLQFQHETFQIVDKILSESSTSSIVYQQFYHLVYIRWLIHSDFGQQRFADFSPYFFHLYYFYLSILQGFAQASQLHFTNEFVLKYASLSEASLFMSILLATSQAFLLFFF